MNKNKVTMYLKKGVSKKNNRPYYLLCSEYEFSSGKKYVERRFLTELEYNYLMCEDLEYYEN